MYNLSIKTAILLDSIIQRAYSKIFYRHFKFIIIILYAMKNSQNLTDNTKKRKEK